ncbi:MAG: class I SAM-dependent methyltransferase [Candidatus Cyclobacteriaceae bacterium M2_1C_046]
MTCAHCCDTNKFFDDKTARKELKHYNKKGPTGTTRAILKALSEIPKKDKTLLDIGGGIGAIQWEFLKEGAKHSTDVDAATGYIEHARSVAKEYGYQDKTTFLQGDFNDVADQLPAFDFVTLDRVVCCYPDYEMILKNSTAKAREYIALSYPISNSISRALNKIGRLYFIIKKSEFKTYIHPAKKIEELIENEGFQAIHNSMKFPWHIRVYKRS